MLIQRDGQAIRRVFRRGSTLNFHEENDDVKRFVSILLFVRATGAEAPLS